MALIRRIFKLAAEHGASSIALPAISTGARRYPPHLAAMISVAVARAEVLASGQTLQVYLVGFGDHGKMKHEFHRFKAAAMRGE